MAASNVGLICPCHRAEYYVKYLKRLNYEIRALWTPSFETTVQFAAEYEIPFAANLPDEVLLRKEVEMVIITDRPSIHAQIAVKALGIGKHVLCDSPAALTAADAYKMVQAAQYYPQLLGLVGYGLRQTEVFKKMKGAVAQGLLGSPLVCQVTVTCGALSRSDYDWLWEHSMGGGVLNVVGSHVIDLLCYIVGHRASRVQGLVRHVRTNAECFTEEYCHRTLNVDDFVTFLMKFDDVDVSATVTLNCLCSDAQFQQELTLCGPNGQLCSRNLDLYKREDKTGQLQLVSKEPEGQPPVSCGQHGGVPGFYADTFLKICENLSKVFPSGNSPSKHSNMTQQSDACTVNEFAGFEDAQYVRAVIDAVRYSSTNGDWVKVELPNNNELSLSNC